MRHGDASSRGVGHSPTVGDDANDAPVVSAEDHAAAIRGQLRSRFLRVRAEAMASASTMDTAHRESLESNRNRRRAQIHRIEGLSGGVDSEPTHADGGSADATDNRGGTAVAVDQIEAKASLERDLLQGPENRRSLSLMALIDRFISAGLSHHQDKVTVETMLSFTRASGLFDEDTLMRGYGQGLAKRLAWAHLLCLPHVWAAFSIMVHENTVIQSARGGSGLPVRGQRRAKHKSRGRAWDGTIPEGVEPGVTKADSLQLLFITLGQFLHHAIKEGYATPLLQETLVLFHARRERLGLPRLDEVTAWDMLYVARFCLCLCT